MSKPIHRVWMFRSDSDPDREYETLLYTDGSASCNCPGWTRRVAPDGSRSCKHTRAVDMDRADRLCSSTHTYQPLNPTSKSNHARHRKTSETPRLGQRRIAV